ncbi:MAG: nicotinamide mononucleotide transporter [Bacteroidia bacterium]|nr:nicotinamide mononucleotide transporter [Bacteroidia bacterium]
MKIIEWIGVISGIIAVYLLYRNSIYTWVTGYINILCFLILFWHEKLYGDFAVQIIFLILGIWGWINWHNSKASFPQKLTFLGNLLALLFTLLVWDGVYMYFKIYTKCTYPIAESLILSLSISGQILTALRKLENWYYWIIADIIMCIVYYYKELYPTSIYAIIITFIGVFGLLRWKKLMKGN